MFYLLAGRAAIKIYIRMKPPRANLVASERRAKKKNVPLLILSAIANAGLFPWVTYLPLPEMYCQNLMS